MANALPTYQLISDILSFESSAKQLENTLSQNNINWEAFVTLGSKHLVLPTLYCRLQSKKLLHLLPEDLVGYLKELTAINRNRNEALLKQAKALSQLFDEHAIEHVFLKGTALLASNYYGDIAERMVGDIDVLVNKNQLEKAFEIAKKNGYEPIASTLGSDFFEHKHLPRMTTKTHIAALEIHLKLFIDYKHDSLEPENILKNRNRRTVIDIPSKEHLLLHNALNQEVNDKGAYYRSLNFKSAFDSLVLLNMMEIVPKHWSKNKIIRGYFKRMALFFPEITNNSDFKPSMVTKLYFLKIGYPYINKIQVKLLDFISFLKVILHRSLLFISNSNYRNAILKDQKRVVSHIKHKLFSKN